MRARRTRVGAWKLTTVFVATIAVLATLYVTGIIGGSSQPKASAAPADTLNFQARLQSSSGAIVPDGSYSIQFNLYDLATGGSSLWTETNSVSVVNGYVSVYLGANTPFPNNIAWDQSTYVTMNVNSDGEMSPRLKLTAVPYAFMAKYANQLQASNGGNIATLSFLTPTASNTISLPDASGTVCLTATCIQNSTSLQTGNFAIASSAAGSVTATIQGNASQSANILEIKNGAGNTTGGFNSSG
ncbi:MAG: hypothetical protein WCF91_02345, partial [bacterium]